MGFKNRVDAGRELAQALAKYKDKRPAILALPRGGVPVAAEVAAALDAPLDLILVRKIGVPMQPELAMGAVVDGGTPIVVRNEDVIRLAGIDESEFKAVCDEELAEIERRRQRYLGNRPRVDIAGCTAIIVDDGIATGATTRAALQAAACQPRSCREPRMETYPVDIDPGQIVRWIKAECEAAPATFKIDARRNTEVREGPAAKRRLTRLLNAIETNRPHSTRG